MIEAAEFVAPAHGLGLARYAGVPCSFLTPFIDHVIDDAGLPCLTAANEGEAVAAMAGAALGGHPGVAMMQNSGLGNAVSPLTSLAWVFRLPVLLVVTWRGAPDLKDEPQHELMGRITGQLLDTMQVPWEHFPAEPAAVAPALQRALRHLRTEHRPFALLMRRGTITPRPPRTQRMLRPSEMVMPSPTREESDPARWPTRAEALRRLLEHTRPEGGTVVIATTGYTGRELCALDDRPNHFYMVGSMGCATAVALGLAQARPDLRVVVIDGDGAALMRMGSFATIGAQAGGNLIHLLLDNQMHESTGGQPTVSSRVHFAGIAAACGYHQALESDRLDALDALLADSTPSSPGPRFLHLRIRPGVADRLPRPGLTPVQVKERLMSHVGATLWGAS